MINHERVRHGQALAGASQNVSFGFGPTSTTSNMRLSDGKADSRKLRVGRALCVFRKTCRLEVAPHPPRSQQHCKTSRTCFEGPFGEVVRATGPMAKPNPLRFSTKYQDDDTDLVYYGYRYYSANIGRWLTRD